MEASATPADRLGWYVRRLRSMEKGELFWRVRQILLRTRSHEMPTDADLLRPDVGDWTAALERFRAGSGRPILLDRERAKAIAAREPQLVAQLIALADESADYRFRFFGYPPVPLKRPIDWHHDPIADFRWPDSPSHRIDHRTAGGNVKWIWELNRLQHLPLLAQAWLYTGDDRYSRAAFEHLDTWMDQNPPGRGIAWRGAFEAGMRAISISVALQGLRDAPELTVERYQHIVGVLAQSALRCWQDRSRFSSANNHLIGEMAGLAVISVMFPELRSASRWEQQAVQTLSVEAQKQILPDGAGAEQSVAYQMAAVELFHLVAALLVERDGRAASAIIDAMSRSGAFLAAIVGRDDPDPRYGDSDQEFAVRLGPEPARTVREHLGVLATFGWDGAPADIISNSLSAEWYRSMTQSTSAHPTSGGRGGQPAGSDRSFYAPDGGLVVLRHGRRRITMDIGPLGYLSIAAHGHADSLAVTLSDGGVDLIGDPGTGSYYRHPSWRAMMRGTRAHPTVCVDGQDQSVIGGPFLWSRHARTKLLGLDLSRGVVDAEHDGYTRLPGRIVHRRWLIAPPNDRVQLVVDLITGVGTHEVRTCWPLHPSLDSHRTERAHVIRRRDEPVLQLLHASTPSLTFDDRFGDERDDLGWWSDLLESRVPAWWLSAVCCAELPLAIATLISPMDGVQTAGLEVTLQEDSMDVAWTEGANARTVGIRVGRPAAITHGTGDQ